MRLVGLPEVTEKDWFSSAAGRAAHVDLLDDAVATWIGQRTEAEVVAAFSEADAAVAPVYDAADVLSDPHVSATEMITTVSDPDLGEMAMQNVLFRMSETPGAIRSHRRSTRRAHGRRPRRVGGRSRPIAELRASGVVA